MRDFKKLAAWQRSRMLINDVYDAVGEFPQIERFGLATQITRSANSIGANIAEGAGRGTAVDYARFVGYALASLNELEHHLIVAGDRGYVDANRLPVLNGEVRHIRAMLVRLRRAILAG